ncbi:MAG: FkbM family methyltransferase, partial [Verrucomicrobia bacterium]|nr:FkbM family methyltransferase [Verrucomicrobiota bacterium]
MPPGGLVSSFSHFHMNRLGKILQQFAKPEGRSPAEQGTGCLSRLVLEFLNPGDLVFDVGAHIGEKTGSFLAAGATVVCVEPQPKCVEMLRAKYGAEPRVSIEALGIADKPGQLQLSVCSTAPTISTFADSWKHGRFADCQWDQTMMVEVTTLDALVAKYGRPKYCKIDVEGFDLAVLNGLSAPVPYLSFEFTVEFLNLAEKCVARLSSIGLSE